MYTFDDRINHIQSSISYVCSAKPKKNLDFYPPPHVHFIVRLGRFIHLHALDSVLGSVTFARLHTWGVGVGQEKGKKRGCLDGE